MVPPDLTPNKVLASPARWARVIPPGHPPAPPSKGESSIFIGRGGTWRHDNSPENASGFAISANNQMNWGQLSLEAPEPKSPSSLDRYSSSGALVSAAQDRSVRIHSRT